MKNLVLLIVALTACHQGIEPWDNAKIKVYIDKSFGLSQVKDINEVIHYINRTTTVRVVPVDAPGDYICTIIRAAVSSAPVGKNRDCEITLSNTNTHTIVHEFGHVIGLHHEHQRPDRDIYIKIHWDRIPKESAHNYDARLDHLYHISDHPYDTESVMHYKGYGGVSKLPTLTDKKNNLIGHYDSEQVFSTGDLAKIRDIYPE